MGNYDFNIKGVESSVLSRGSHCRSGPNVFSPDRRKRDIALLFVSITVFIKVLSPSQCTLSFVFLIGLKW